MTRIKTQLSTNVINASGTKGMEGEMGSAEERKVEGTGRSIA